jgi:RNA polymerase sporulation-specific sigma factor
VFEEDSDQTFIDNIVETKITNPEELLISQENRNFIEESISKVLTPLECTVLELYLEGKNYSQISAIVQKPEKSIDNALQRVKRKLDKFLKESSKKN